MIVDNTQGLLKRLDDGEIDFALVEGFFKKTEYVEILKKRDFCVCCTGQAQKEDQWYVSGKDRGSMAKQTKILFYRRRYAGGGLVRIGRKA